jgi:dihydroorotase
VTTVFEMPNTDPSTTSPEMMLDKLARAKGRMHTDHAFYAGATHDNTDMLHEMEMMAGVCGIKVWIFKCEILGHDPMSQELLMMEAQTSGVRPQSDRR